MAAVILGMILTVAMAWADWMNNRESGRAYWIILWGWFIVLTIGLVGGA